MEIISKVSKLKLSSGLHIGMQDDGMRIGGIDSPVIKREVLSNDEGQISFEGKKVLEPYIPGSSLKGKVRSLLEHYFLLIDPNDKIGDVVTSKSTYGDKKKRDLIVKLFGEAANLKGDQKGVISRLIFRDCFITEDVRKAKIEDKLEFFEAKMENVIDRKTGTTKNGGLRTVERVNSSLEFDFEVSIRCFPEDNKELFENTLLLGLKLLELDALGGSGSRGYGKVIFSDFKNDIKELANKVEEEIKKAK